MTLAVLPAVSVLGFGVLGTMATFQAFAGVHRSCGAATNFAITNPAMEVLFTVVPSRGQVQGEERDRDVRLSRRRSNRRVGRTQVWRRSDSRCRASPSSRFRSRCAGSGLASGWAAARRRWPRRIGAPAVVAK